MSVVNPSLNMTLQDAVAEVLGLLTGLDLSYVPELDRFNAVTRQLNRSLRACALEREWSWYASTENLGSVAPGAMSLDIDPTLRPRVIGDDAVRLVSGTDKIMAWAYFLPRDALHKYRWRNGLWCAVVGNTLQFSRPLTKTERELSVHLPVMREPEMFRLPEQPEDPEEPLVEVPQEVLDQPIDFPYPDLVILRAAYYYAQTDPVMQPRVQTLEVQYKDMMYQIIEREDRHTDAPFVNDFQVPVSSGINDYRTGWWQNHPHSDERG